MSKRRKMTKDQLLNLLTLVIAVPYTIIALIGLLTRDIDWILPWMIGLGIPLFLLACLSGVYSRRRQKMNTAEEKRKQAGNN